MTCTYVRYNNLKKTGQLRNVWVEFGFGTVCLGGHKTFVNLFCFKLVGFPSRYLETDGWNSNRALVGFPSNGWISNHWLEIHP